MALDDVSALEKAKIERHKQMMLQNSILSCSTEGIITMARENGVYMIEHFNPIGMEILKKAISYSSHWNVVTEHLISINKNIQRCKPI